MTSSYRVERRVRRLRLRLRRGRLCYEEKTNTVAILLERTGLTSWRGDLISMRNVVVDVCGSIQLLSRFVWFELGQVTSSPFDLPKQTRQCPCVSYLKQSVSGRGEAAPRMSRRG